MKKYIYALIRKEDMFLILKRPEDKLNYPGYWNLPGGKPEDDETDRECVIREVKEETGLDFLPIAELIDIIDDNPPKKRIIVFAGEAAGTVSINSEHDQFRWVKKSDISSYKTMPYFEELLQVILK